MSTKTTFKRIALVTVAAMGFGILSVAPSGAAGLASDLVTLGSPSKSTAIDVPATSSVTLTGYCVADGDLGVYAIYIKSVPATGTGTVGPLLMTASTGTGSTTGPVTIGQAGEGSATDAVVVSCTGAGFYTAKATVSATVPSAGTYVFAVEGVYQAGSKKEFTVTAAARAAVSAKFSTSIIEPLTGAFGNDEDGVSAPKANGASFRTEITLKNATESTTRVEDVSALTATITGPGVLQWNDDASLGRSITASAKSLDPVLYVWSDGNAGTSEITISMGTTVISTEKVVFYGSVAKLTATAVRSVVPDATGTGTNNDLSSGIGAFKVTAVDSLGLAVPNLSIKLVSSDTAIANYDYATCGTTGLTGSVTCDIYGVKAGNATITATTNASATVTTGVSSSAVAYRVSEGKIAKISTTFNGQKDATLDQKSVFKARMTLSDANGPVTKGCYNIALDPDGDEERYNTPWFEAGQSGVPFGYWGDVCVNHEGFYEFTDVAYYYGVGSGVIQTAKKPLPGVTYDLSILTVSNDLADAATDAAAEAIDAANAATDAANAAAEAADAATAAAQDAADAVAALSTQVAEMIDALKKQITALTNLVIKIQKKVKA